MSNGKAIQATFCTAPPTLVSYICIWCPDLPPTELTMGLTIETAEADLVLFRVPLSSASYYMDHFVYKASGSKGPSLTRIDGLRRYMIYHHHNTGLVARRDFGEGSRIASTPTEDDEDHFYIAILNRDIQKPSSFNLCVYNSVDKIWSVSSVPYLHFTSKVIKLGECGLLGFVDPWRGILVCDIFGCKPVHYLLLLRHPIAADKDDALLFRDVALVEGRLTLVELHRSTDPCDSSTKRRSWDLSTWSISSPWKGQDDWRMDYTVESRRVLVDDNNNNNTDLLARLPATGGTSDQRSLGRLLHIAHPILSLSDKRVVFLMGKVCIRDNKAFVLSVDMKNSRLQGAAVFGAERLLAYFDYTFIQSTISSYFNMAPGAKGKHKRPGKFHMLYPRKYQFGVNMNDGGMYLTSHIPVGVHEREESGAEDRDDYMLLD